MSFQVAFSTIFWKNFGKLTADEKSRTMNKLLLLAENPHHPSLRSKSVKGFPAVFESSVTMGIRILWKYKNDSTMYLSDIGHHDIMKNP